MQSDFSDLSCDKAGTPMKLVGKKFCTCAEEDPVICKWLTVG